MMFVVSGHCKLRAILLALLAVLVVVCLACATPAVPKQNPESKPQPEPQKDTPVIQHLRAPKEIAPSETLQIACTAATKNNDILSYEWSATGGQIQGKGDRVVWVAPSTTGDNTITVVVSDGKGNKAAGSVTILVTPNPNHPPVIHIITCQDCASGTQASKWKTYSIQCDASDPEGGELSYEWSVTIGKIEGKGRLATWQIFGQYGYAVITVKVRDDRGNETEGYLAVTIACCD